MGACFLALASPDLQQQRRNMSFTSMSIYVCVCEYTSATTCLLRYLSTTDFLWTGSKSNKAFIDGHYRGHTYSEITLVPQEQRCWATAKQIFDIADMLSVLRVQNLESSEAHFQVKKNLFICVLQRGLVSFTMGKETRPLGSCSSRFCWVNGVTGVWIPSCTNETWVTFYFTGLDMSLFVGGNYPATLWTLLKITPKLPQLLSQKWLKVTPVLLFFFFKNVPLSKKPPAGFCLASADHVILISNQFLADTTSAAH